MNSTRLEVLQSPDYHTQAIQLELYNAVYDYLERTGMNRTQLAEKLGVSKGYVSQLLNGSFDHKLSKLVELSIAIGLAPHFDLIPFEDYDRKVHHNALSTSNLSAYASSIGGGTIDLSTIELKGNQLITYKTEANFVSNLTEGRPSHRSVTNQWIKPRTETFSLPA